MTRCEQRLRKRLAQNVRRLRVGASLTLEEASWRGGMHWRQWQKIESGERNATIMTLCRLSQALGVDPAVLLQG